MSGPDSEAALRERGEHGSFLVRASQSQPGRFALSVRCGDAISHIIIRNNGGSFDVGGGASFTDLTSLVEYYKRKPLVEANGNVVHLLKETEEEFGKAGFNEEFEQLQTMEHQHKFDRMEGARIENKSKNRYKNILPYDHTRVKLRNVPDGVIGADYINANFINGEAPGTDKAYIASQGTMPDTVADFWQMIVEQNCRLVVMATNPVEKGKHKCTPYWPSSERRPARFGNYVVELLTEDNFDAYTVRRMSVAVGEGDPREIYQYHYTSWPDHGVPPEREFLQLIMKIRQHRDRLRKSIPGLGPTLVHCRQVHANPRDQFQSAGIGRTGTFLVIDIVLDLIRHYGIDCDIDIQSIIHKLRGQRSGMIQTAAQYRFIYKAVMDYIQSHKSRP
ncbi:uncharacterized protein MONBRDRAFT_27512 [Monosiga brevicollis MX1]|uniref:Tyrosine-protein phosphatase non-receptor type 11 n=1 Tax=Monosiga brevicollis TaxID=81824 RepID=A9V5H3_MONBE|nr:uncharacterized protein MONBRDRAFT_27512 [Monosiga brevicollis MX1]EDQ87370.1 predicted protein [Monosiga brevicollis MX1]|eukprot:XP_001747983.1 hypothetical protein [Monosiga brevicollis MX1]